MKKKVLNTVWIVLMILTVAFFYYVRREMIYNDNFKASILVKCLSIIGMLVACYSVFRIIVLIGNAVTRMIAGNPHWQHGYEDKEHNLHCAHYNHQERVYYDNLKDFLASIDVMNGHEFEHFCAGILRKNGFTNVVVTPGSGDQGADILAEKDGISYAIQCKRYDSVLGNKPIQEIHAAKDYYGCDRGVVLTNSIFTRAAMQLALRTNTELWDRNELVRLINNAY
ncbi:MAG: restriction endonuclease [Oscillospiraceae bacterium]|nr:restriction endonuclease [Oscillospiraceae bacterium]